MATWPEWNSDMEWARLDGAFAQGATGALKPKGGPQVKFVIEELVTNKKLVDVSLLLGARLTFNHTLSMNAQNETVIDVVVTMSGPMMWFWDLVIGKGIKESAQRDLDNLVAVAERQA